MTGESSGHERIVRDGTTARTRREGSAARTEVEESLADRVLDLQRRAGNAAVASLMPAARPQVTVQRGLGGWLRSLFSPTPKKPEVSAPTGGATMTKEQQGEALSAKELEAASAKLGGELVNAKTKEELDEAIAIVTKLKDDYGVTLQSAMTIEGIKAQYNKVAASETAKLKAGVWEMKELRALAKAVARFGPILGGARASSSLAGKVQGVTTIGRLRQAIDRNSAEGTVDNTTMGEYFGGKENVGLFDTVTNLTDRRYIPEGGTAADNATTLEANSIHEMAHGLIQPIELGNWLSTMTFWTDQYTPSGTEGAEAPPTPYGKTGGAAEDLCESVAIFFTNRPRLKDIAPAREAFLAKMVAGWTPVKTKEVVSASVGASGSGT